jgi:hypothetical protein
MIATIAILLQTRTLFLNSLIVDTDSFAISFDVRQFVRFFLGKSDDVLPLNALEFG